MLTSYLVANAIILPMGGWFSMLFGRKRFYMICVALFTVSSLLCGMAPTLGALIFFRVLQGLGGGALQPISQAILVESFPREKQGMAMAVFGMGVVVAARHRPHPGRLDHRQLHLALDLLHQHPGGHRLALSLTAWLIYDPPYLRRTSLGDGLKIDYTGFGLLALGLGALEVVLDEGQKNDWFCLPLHRRLRHHHGRLPGGRGLLGAASRKHPIIDFRILKDRNYTLATVSMLVLGFVLYGSTALLPMFLQTLLGYTAMLSGLVLSPGGLVVLVLMPRGGHAAAPLSAALAGDFRRVVISAAGLFRHGQVQPGDRLRHRRPQPHGAKLRPGVPLRAHQHRGFRLHPQRAHQLRHRPVQPGAQHRRQLRHRHRHHLLARRAQFHQSVLVAHLTPYDCNYRESLAGSRLATLQPAAPPRPMPPCRPRPDLRQMFSGNPACWHLRTLFG